MENILTYKQITDVIKNIAQSHFQLENVFFHKRFNIEDGEKKFPILFVYPNQVSLPINNNGLFLFKEFSLTFEIFSLINKENDNEIDLFSDTEQILSDIVTILSSHPELQKKNASISSSLALFPIWEELDSNSNGWSTVITIRTMNPIAFCQTPTNY